MRFTQEQLVFLKKELGVSVSPNATMTCSEWESIKEKVLDIEIEEARPDGELSQRGRVAVEIGNMRYAK